MNEEMIKFFKYCNDFFFAMGYYSALINSGKTKQEAYDILISNPELKKKIIKKYKIFP